MSLDHTKNLLKTLQDNDKSEIILNITKHDFIIATVSYINNLFQITYLESNAVELYADIETMSVVIKNIENSFEMVSSL